MIFSVWFSLLLSFGCLAAKRGSSLAFSVDGLPSQQPRYPTPSSNPVTYDLGIGKNQPVRSDKGKCSDHTSSPVHFTAKGLSADTIVRYWVEHESVRDFPSPLAPRQDNSTPVGPQSSRVTPTISLRRRALDVVLIQNQQSPLLPTATTATTRQQPRSNTLNTAWVEMLIHEQQQLAAATSA